MNSTVDVGKELRAHALLWLGYFVFEVFAYVNYDYTFGELVYLFFLALPAKVIFIYPTLFWTVLKYFFNKKYFQFSSITLGILLLSMVIHRNSVHYGFLQFYRPEVFQSIPVWDAKMLFRSFEFILTIGSVFIAFSLVRLSYKQHELNNQLVTANISAELKNLKEQIKPHFLFNTLNNLYGLTRKDPERASEVVMRLSQLMNYVLYSANLQKVSIIKELSYLEDYIEVERIRYGEQVQIVFQKQIADTNVEISPLLLQPFVENAFKHGLSKQGKGSWLKIDLTVDQKELNFKVTNSKPAGYVNGHSEFSGLGIENVRKRLELLYKNRYRLKTVDEGDSFLVNLTLFGSGPDDLKLPKTVHDNGKVPAN